MTELRVGIFGGAMGDRRRRGAGTGHDHAGASVGVGANPLEVGGQRLYGPPAEISITIPVFMT